jgi:hypothetical protein
MKVNVRQWSAVGIGLGLGLLIGVGMMVGTLVTLGNQGQQLLLPTTNLQASATHSAGSMAIATGPIDDEVEGLYTLDFLTGELQCVVISPRAKGANMLTARFVANPAKDLGIDASKKPNFLMVTGAFKGNVGGGGAKPAQSVVYVVDTNTGKFVGYGFFWNQTAARSGREQGGPMKVIAGGVVRRAVIE